MTRSLSDVFELDGPSSEGSVFDVQVYKDRIRTALLESGKAGPKIGEKRVSREKFFGLNPEIDKVDAPKKRVDLNEPAKNWLTRKGWDWDRCDYYDARTQRAHDLLGMFDYLAFDGNRTVAIQITSKPNVAAREKKIREEPRLKWVLRASWTVLILGFYKDDNGRWAAIERWIT